MVLRLVHEGVAQIGFSLVRPEHVVEHGRSAPEVIGLDFVVDVELGLAIRVMACDDAPDAGERRESMGCYGGIGGSRDGGHR